MVALSLQRSPQQQAGPGQASPPPAFAVRPTLPDRNVTADTIEDAYVRFIFYCNPALPLTSDTESLREAFRNPPKSGRKTFSTFTVYELVKEFYSKEIKTWTELTIKLGVEPPDTSKDESTQKIAQYGVRLKKWMNSMHVKAFFEYLMEISNDYWNKIPDDPDPTGQAVRDGVALEDDMALRALLPHIRPKRGRKRPDNDEGANTPVQRQRLSPPSAIDDHRQPALGPWSSQLADGARGWAANDMMQTPLTRWPQSAITPATGKAFWNEVAEPRSAITPSKPKLSNQRRGAKNVSSAWKPGGPDSGTKTRGRPPINRTPVEDSGYLDGMVAVPSLVPMLPGVTANPGANNTADAVVSPRGPARPAATLSRTTSAPVPGRQTPQRPARPSISLQVPQRSGGAVRLATPPPAVVINGEANGAQQPHSSGGNQFLFRRWDTWAQEVAAAYYPAEEPRTNGAGEAPDMGEFYFEKMEDRTNVDAIVTLLTQTALEADWVDAEGQPTEPASIEEATALVHSSLESLRRSAPSSQAFLIHLAALAGSRALMTSRGRYTRLGDNGGAEGSSRYRIQWEYRFGHVRGNFATAQEVPRTMWHRPEAEAEAGPSALSAEVWRRKYESLVEEMGRRNEELTELRTRVWGSGRE